MGIYQVDPFTIPLSSQPSAREVKEQRDRLLVEGQIEPIKLNRRTGSPCTGPHGWVYADAQIMAARELGWATVLVTY